MSLQRHLGSAVLAAGLTLTLVACGPDSKPESASTPSATPTPTPTATSTTPTVVPTTPAAPAPAARTKATLTKALLALEDLPAGFAVEPTPEGDDGAELSSTNSKCKKLVQLFNADASPGAKITVDRGFSGGQNGPFVAERLEAMPSARATTALLTTIKAAVKSCTKAKLTIEGAGTSTVSVTEVAAPKAGTSPFAVRFVADGGPLEGLEVSFVFAGLDDVLLSMNFDDSSDIEEPTLAAAEKATTLLGTSKTGT